MSLDSTNVLEIGTKIKDQPKGALVQHDLLYKPFNFKRLSLLEL
jgi:hypothetical protein